MLITKMKQRIFRVIDLHGQNEKIGFKRDFSRFLMYKLTRFKKKRYLKAKNSLHTIRISSFKNVFIVFSEKSDAKIYIAFWVNHYDFGKLY